MDNGEIERVSKLLFGSRHRLTIAVAVATAPEDRIYGRAIVERTGLGDSQVWLELRRLEEAGLLERLPPQGNRSPQFFRRVPSAFWKWVTELAAGVGRSALPLARWLEGGETQTLDVRGSLSTSLEPWIRTGGRLIESRDAAQMTLKCIAAFLNSGGGTLVLGAVEESRYRDDRRAMERLAAFPRAGPYVVVGLRDPTFTKYGWDVWERRFMELLNHSIDPRPPLFVICRREELAGQALGIVTVSAPRKAEPFFLRGLRGELVYYVREGPALAALHGSQMVRHWRTIEKRYLDGPRSTGSPEEV